MSMSSVNYHNSKTYDAEQWLAERNKVIVEFLSGLGKLQVATKQSIKTTLVMDKTMEELYHLRDNCLVLPLSFLQNIMVQIKSSSKAAVDIQAALSPGGPYTYNRH